MKMKKLFAAAAASVLMMSILVVPAYAHGGHGGGHGNGHGHGNCANASYSSTNYQVCNVKDCTQSGRHEHDGVTYCGHDNGNHENHSHNYY